MLILPCVSTIKVRESSSDKDDIKRACAYLGAQCRNQQRSTGQAQRLTSEFTRFHRRGHDSSATTSTLQIWKTQSNLKGPKRGPSCCSSRSVRTGWRYWTSVWRGVSTGHERSATNESTHPLEPISQRISTHRIWDKCDHKNILQIVPSTNC